MENPIINKLDTFFSKFTHVTGKKGDIFIHAEEPPDGVLYLKQGLIRQYLITPKGEEVTVNIYKPGSFFPMTWTLNESPNLYYFEAMNTVELWRAPRLEVVDFLKTNSDVMYDLLSRLCKGIDGVLGKITHLMSGDARTKILFTLLNLHYRFANKDVQEINLDTTHKDLAAIAGTTRETFSREIKKLENEGIVTLHNGVLTILNPEKLEEELAGINKKSQ